MLQQSIGKAVVDKKQEEEDKLAEHTARIKAKIESGNAIDKSIIDREAIKELNHKEAHSKAKVVKAIEHKSIQAVQLHIFENFEFSTIIIDAVDQVVDMILLDRLLNKTNIHIYVIATFKSIDYIYRSLNSMNLTSMFEYIHTFKYSSKSHQPKIGYKEHMEYIVYANIGNKPVNHLLPNVIESTYAKDSRNLGFYTNLLLRSANAGDTILGINITNGNLIKAAQAMLCSTVIIPADNIAMRECEKTIKELQFK